MDGARKRFRAPCPHDRKSPCLNSFRPPPHHRFEFPRRLLLGHERGRLSAGEQRRVTIRVARERLATFSVTALRMLAEPGEYIVLAGRSAEDLRLSAALTLEGQASPERQPGDTIRAEHFEAATGLELVPETHLAGTAISVSPGHTRAVAEYRNWAAAPSGRGILRVVKSDGGCVAFERAGAVGSWLPWVTVNIPAGFEGEVAFECPQRDTPADIRLIATGKLVVVDFSLG
ncbi:fibronectin type III-like domain-contianing protein [Arthrobacter psychrolactophilus]